MRRRLAYLTSHEKYKERSRNLNSAFGPSNNIILQNPCTVLNFSYLAIILPNFKLIDKKLLELERRMSHSFDIKIGWK